MKKGLKTLLNVTAISLVIGLGLKGVSNYNNNLKFIEEQRNWMHEERTKSFKNEIAFYEDQIDFMDKVYDLQIQCAKNSIQIEKGIYDLYSSLLPANN